MSFHWDLALADFDRVAELRPDLETVQFHRGRLMFEAGWFDRAKEVLDQFLEVQPDHVKGLTVRGRILRKLGRPLEAAQDYTRALTLASDPGPDVFVERALALREAGNDYLDAAVESLDKASRRLGPLIVLESLAIDLEAERHRYDAALDRIDRVMARMARKERWLVRRAEILRKAGREEEARATYQGALAAVESLPPRLREIPASQQLKDYLRRLLAGSTLRSLPENGSAPARKES